MAIISWAAQAFGAPLVAGVIIVVLAAVWWWSRR
jgi:hypothetical protein